MKKLIGNEIEVFLKGEYKNFYGILIDITDESLYIQVNEKIIIIPKNNVQYSTTYHIPSDTRMIECVSNNLSELHIYINGELLSTINVPNTVDLKTWNNEIMDIAMKCPDVSSFLSGKIQEKVEYSPGVMNIIITKSQGPVIQNSFSMGPANNFLNPLEMVTRLNNAGNPRLK